MASALAKEKYPYKPLDPTKQEIRLITLHPSVSFDAPVILTLSTASIQTNPLYEAISYVWGDPAITAPVTIDGVAVEVTTNLKTALRYFRLDSEIRILWTDAICINQRDDLEKNFQVGMMGDIYRSCTKCLAWLGEDEDGNGKEAFELIEDLAAGIRFPSTEECRELLEHPRTKFSCLQNIMQRSYFSRIWVIQETVLPAQVEYWCGRTTIDRNVWDNAREPILELQRLQLGRFCHTCSDARSKFLAQATSLFINYSRQTSASTSQSPGCLRILHKTMSLLCQNPLDKVYAVLALMSPKDRPCFQVDYNNTSINRLSANVLSTEFDQSGTLLMLGMMDLMESEDGLEFPSWWPFPQWIPELALRYENGSNPKHRLIQDENFSACGSESGLLDLDLVEEGTLGGSGIRVDAIKNAQTFQSWRKQLSTTPSTGQPGSRINLYEAQVFEKESQDELNPNSLGDQGSGPGSYVGGGKLSNAWWQNLVSDSRLAKNHLGYERATEMEEQTFRNVWTMVTTISESDWMAFSQEKGGPEFRLFAAFNTTIHQRSIITTQQGYLGNAPLISRPGDEVHIIAGCSFPLMLRKVSDATATSPAAYLCLGKSYLHGIMDGEAAENFADRATRINLV